MMRSIFVVMASIFLFVGTTPACAGEPAEGESTSLVVLIYDTQCKWACDAVRPIMQELKEKHKDAFSYMELNATQDQLEESKKLAKQNGISWFLEDYSQFVPVVGIFNARRKCVKYLLGKKEKEVYAAALEKALQCK